MKKVFLLFPHQLFAEISLLQDADEVYLVEEYLFFNQYKFHQQKLVFHRASMKYYEDFLRKKGIKVQYVEAIEPHSDVRLLLAEIIATKFGCVAFYDVCDNWLAKRIAATCAQCKMDIQEYPTPLFINTKQDLTSYFGTRKKYFQTDFYIQQRKKWNILIDANGKPQGGKWSFDAENRLKYPKDKVPPKTYFPAITPFYQEAIEYITHYYSNNYGKINQDFAYPTTHAESEAWLQQFLEKRFAEFGEYEDAIVDDAHILHHSVLSPMLNVGLLLPMQIVNSALDYAAKHNVPLNTLEGFIRQIIGWREFIRGVYVYSGTQERNTNFWQFNKAIPPSFYQATTGIEPIDKTLKKLIHTGYNHHIERLMILGNFMQLCEFEPDKVYQWFMEMYIDAYDWVMVPNIYGMSQFADGGLMATKPYISGSSYILKMSNYKKGDWCSIWDALFWHFMHKQRAFFSSNPRLGMLLKTYEKMSEAKKQNIGAIAEDFFARCRP